MPAKLATAVTHVSAGIEGPYLELPHHLLAANGGGRVNL